MMLTILLISSAAATSSRHLRSVSFKTTDEPECLTVGGSDPQAIAGANCSFPFQLNNITYYGCTPGTDSDAQRWCSTKTDDNGLHQQGNWGYCNTSCSPGTPVDCCACVDDPEVQAVGGDCPSLKVFFGCDFELAQLDPRAPPGALVMDLCPATCGQECCACSADDDGQTFIDPVTNAPPARALDVQAADSSSACSDTSWWCRFYAQQCRYDWVKSYCPTTCHQCPAPPSFQLDDTLPELLSTNPRAGRRVERFHPTFYFDENSCYPDYGVSRGAQRNPGLGDSSPTAGCRDPNFMSRANTYHRWAEVPLPVHRIPGRRDEPRERHSYQVHLYSLYFQKDRATYAFWEGHRHAVETVIIYFTDDLPTHIAISAYGQYEVRDIIRGGVIACNERCADSPRDCLCRYANWSLGGARPHQGETLAQIVYHSDPWNTHKFDLPPDTSMATVLKSGTISVLAFWGTSRRWLIGTL